MWLAGQYCLPVETMSLRQIFFQLKLADRREAKVLIFIPSFPDAVISQAISQDCRDITWLVRALESE